ncbi:MAG: NADH-quinone oxidoreductase subunit N [Armatimonadota bacterium]
MPIDLSTVHWHTIGPHLVLAAGALAVLVLAAFVREGSRALCGAVSFLTLAAALAASTARLSRPSTAFDGSLDLDNLALFMELVVLLGSLLTVLISMGRLGSEGIAFGEYYALILLSTCGMLFLVSAADLVMVFLGVELVSIPIYVLAGSARGRLISNEAALKYFLLGAFASGFLLYGIALLYAATGELQLQAVRSAFVSSSHLPMLLISAALILVGLGFKISLVPFHFWTPDVYQGAPTPITAFMSAGPKVAIFAPLLRILLVSMNEVANEWLVAFWALAAVTMTVGNLVAIVQTNIKRLLAYSSIAHAGYVLVAFVALSQPPLARTGDALGQELPVRAICFYLLVYTLANIGAFSVVVALGHKRRGLDLADYAGLGYDRPWLAAAMSLFLLSLAGFPPAAGFLAKLYVFSAAVHAGFYGLVVIAVINGVVSVYYYLRVVVLMYMRPREEPAPLAARTGVYLGFALVFAAVGTIALGVLPGPVLNMLSGVGALLVSR